MQTLIYYFLNIIPQLSNYCYISNNLKLILSELHKECFVFINFIRLLFYLPLSNNYYSYNVKSVIISSFLSKINLLKSSLLEYMDYQIIVIFILSLRVA